MKHPIPAAVLENHCAILGKTGSGKTSTEKLAVEQVIADGFRVCVLDSVKSDWWGITSSADGKKPGLPFRILGGPRGHVPLHSSAGAVIGGLVGSGQLPLSIVDMADFEAGGIQKFFVDFAPALMRSMKGVLYLVLEEAHEFAPKERPGISKGAENVSIHWAKKLATAGRSKGIRLIVATQSIQSLHNAVLGSCETIIAHRLGTPAHQKPVLEWLKANADKETVAEVAAELSSLATGTAWVCSGEAKIFERRSFPLFKTYDNSKSPTKDPKDDNVTTAAVDQDELRSLIGDAVKQAEASDPKILRAEIAKLKKEMAGFAAAAVRGEPVAPKADLRAEYQRGLAEGDAAGYARGAANGGKAIARILKDTKRSLADIPKVTAVLKKQVETLDLISKMVDSALESEISLAGKAATAPAPVAAIAEPRTTREFDAKPPSVAPKRPAQMNGGAAGLSNPQLKVLEGLAWWLGMGHDKPTKAQLAGKIGWTVNGSNLRGRLAELSTAGLISYPASGAVALTQAGTDAAPTPDLNGTLVDSIRAMLSNPQRVVFDALLNRDGQVTKEDLGSAIGWESGGSNLRGRLAELSSLEMISYPERGTVALQDWVRH